MRLSKKRAPWCLCAVLLLATPTVGLFGQDPFLRGDINCDGCVSLADGYLIEAFLFTGYVPPCNCEAARDADGDLTVAVTDGVYALNHLVLNGPPPPAPYPSCGPWVAGMLPCLDYPDCPLFKRGDANGGGCVNADDATYINDFLFLAGPAPPCMLAANAADDDQILIGDSVYILAYCTTGGPAPPAPGAFVCGDDPTPGVLTAATLRAARVARISFPAIAIRTGIWISAMPCTSSGLFSTRPPRRFPAVTEARTTLPTAGS